MALPDIKALITASTEGFETALLRAARVSQTTTDQIKEHTEKINQSFERLKVVAETALAFFAVEKFKGMIEGSLEAAQKLDRLAQSTGIAVETLGGLGFAAHLADVDIDSAAAGFVKLDKSIAAAAAGNKEATAVYTALGLSVRDASGHVKGADEILVEAADKFAGYEDGANKTALAIALFGKRGAELIPLLNQGGAAIEQNRQYYEKYSGVTAELTEKAAAFEDTQKKLGLLSGAFANQLTAELLPAMQGIADRLLDMKQNGDQFRGVAHDLAEVLKEVAIGGTFVAQALDAIIRGFATAGKNISALLHGTPADAIDNVKEYAASLSEAQKRYSALREELNAGSKAKVGSRFDDDYYRRTVKGEAPGIAQVKEAKETIDPFVAYLDNLNKEGLKLNFDITNFDRFKGAAGTSKEALVDFDVEFGKFSDAARTAAKLPILSDADKARLIAAGQEVAKQAEQLERIRAIHAFDDNIKSIQLQTDNIGKSNEQIEISTKLLELEKAGVKAGSDEYAKRVATVTDAVHKLTVAQQAFQLQGFAYSGSQAHDEAIFQLSMIGKSRDAIEDLTAKRQIDLEVRQKAFNAAGELNDQSGQELAGLQAVAEKRKAQLVADNAAQRESQRSALTGSQQFFNDYVDQAHDAATQVKGLLTDAFGGAEDAFASFVTTGKGDFKSLVTSINGDIARIAFKQATTQGLEALKSSFGNDTFVGKLLGGINGGGGTTAASSTAAITGFSSALTTQTSIVNSSLDVMSSAAYAAAAALQAVAGKSASGLLGSFGTGFSALGSTTATAGNSINAGGGFTAEAIELFSAMGNVFNKGNAVPFASGGVVDRPTIFPMRRGMGMMGEAGPEAIIPLRRHANGKLGIDASGQKPSTTVINNVNVQAPATRDLRSSRQYGEDIRRALNH